MSDGYEMKDLHRSLLIKSRVYLLHNIRPTDLLWGNLIGWQVLSTDMVETIRVGRNTHKKCFLYSKKIDMLIRRNI